MLLGPATRECQRPNQTVDAATAYGYKALGQLTYETVLINGQESVRTFEYNNQGLRTLTRVKGFVAVQGSSIRAESIDCGPGPGVRPWPTTSRSVLECGSALPLSLCRGRSGPQGGSHCTRNSPRYRKRQVRKPQRRGGAEALGLCVLCELCGSNGWPLRGGSRGFQPQRAQRTQRKRRRRAAVAALSSVVRPLSSPAYGSDLSGTLQGAGGIGGLLARARHSTTSPYAINDLSCYHADGNGNVTYLAGSTGAADAAYKYDPFGRTLANTGGYAAANVYRFSSKAVHAPCGLYYYGYRFYDPNTQRWPNGDPIGEEGGVNLYNYVFNDPMNEVDPFGLQITPAIPPYPVISKPDPSCVAQCDKQFDDCLGKRMIICSIGGGAAGAGAQIYSKTGRYPGKERFLLCHAGVGALETPQHTRVPAAHAGGRRAGAHRAIHPQTLR